MVSTYQKMRDTLPEFQKYMLDRKLVAENKTTFFAYWVVRFLSYAKRHKLSADEYQEATVAAFLDELRLDQRIKDWQPQQAEDALKLYYFQYLGKSKNGQDNPAFGSTSAILEEISRIIRLKHYSYSTERTYLQWAERFFAYIAETGGKQADAATAEDVRDFLSHLALEQNVFAA